MNVVRALCRAVCIGAAAGAAAGSPMHPDIVSRWNEHALALGGTTRTMAMVHLAMFDAVNAIEPRYRPYLSLPAPPVGALAEAAAASAAHGVLLRLQPARAAELNAALNESLGELPDGVARTNGVQYGALVAQAIYQNRLNDNILVPGPAYVSTGEPGDYQLTVPGPPQPVNSNAPNWVPFALASASQFRPGAPPALSSRRYANDLNETRALGEVTSVFRTATDDETARWHTEQAQFQLNRIARTESVLDGYDLLDHARLFALLNLALADASISVFDAKYTYRLWRPVTAIRNADIDDNDRTTADTGWSPFLSTPPHPEYPAAHGVIQTAGARVLERHFGPHHAFSTVSAAVPGVIRSYEDFDAFAEEGGLARIFGGMHFRNSIEVGHRQGKSVANWILDRFLLPLESQAPPARSSNSYFQFTGRRLW